MFVRIFFNLSLFDRPFATSSAAYSARAQTTKRPQSSSGFCSVASGVSEDFKHGFSEIAVCFDKRDPGRPFEAFGGLTVAHGGTGEV